MKFGMEFTPIPLENLHREAAVMKTEGWRFIQTHAVNTDNGIDLYYSFMKDGLIRNLKVEGVTKEQSVPSVTDMFLAAFVFENEARELFGVDMRDIAIDFAGALYAPAESEPMTFMTPEQKAARDKARKAQNAPASDESTGKKKGFVMTPERLERLNKKLATMSADKVAKVKAALKAREEEAAAEAAAPADKPAEVPAEKPEPAASPVEAAKPLKAVDQQLEDKIALLVSEKAEKVRAALAARRGEAPQTCEEPEPLQLDAELEAKLALLDEEKARKVREAFAAKAAREASSKGGE